MFLYKCITFRENKMPLLKKKHLPLESTAVPIILNVNNKAVHTEELYK